MSSLDHGSRLRPWEPHRTIVPRRLPQALPEDVTTNATVVEPFNLYNCGLVGSAGFKRTIPAGTRARVEESHPGLFRVYLDGRDERGPLVDAEHFRLDEDVRREP